MTSHVSHVMTLANSIIGVSVLAMPFCFKQCGIVLATVVLLLCSLLSRLACHFLIKSAVMSRRRNFEFLAFHAFGHMGKFFVELFIIGFLLGTCIAFFVVIGDLGPQIVGKMLNKSPENIRTSFLLTTGALIVLPLGLLKNIDSLASISTATIGFYLCLVLKVILESTNHVVKGDWYDRVNYWRPSGILQCLPIFSMALFCQTQLFEIYESIMNVSLEKMNLVVREALNICTMVYLCVGFFGYVAFCTEPFAGNILMVLEPSPTSDMIKIGFVLSVVFSFPLVIFPCRASLNSLFFKRVHTHEQVTNYIPETRFRCLTLTIVTVALITGILMPNIEFVLGLVGSTIGVMICLILPAACFIVISTKNTNERLVAQVICFIGIWIMILGTYANLYAMEEASTLKIIPNTEKPLGVVNTIDLNLLKVNDKLLLPEAPLVPVIPRENIEILPPNFKIEVDKHPEAVSRPLEPSVNVPLKPVEKIITKIVPVSSKPQIPKKEIPKPPEDPKIVETIKQDQQASELLLNSETKKNADAGNLKNPPEPTDLRKDNFLQKLEEHKDDIRKLIEEQKVLLQDIEHHQEELEMEKRKRLQSKEDPKNDETEKTNSKDEVEKKVSKENIKHNEIPKIELNNEPEKRKKLMSKIDNSVENDSNKIALTNEIQNLKENEIAEEKKIPENGSPKKLSSKTDAKIEETPKNDQNLANVKRNIKNSEPKEVEKKSNLVDSNKTVNLNFNLSSVESRGPIVDVLTNWTASRNLQDAQFEKHDGKNVKEKIDEVKRNINQQLPIPLKLINKTKDSDKTSSDNIEIEGKIRDKREAEQNETSPTFGNILQKTERLNDGIALDSSSNIDVDCQKSNKRDLKALKCSGNL